MLKMTEDIFEKRYATRIEWSDNFTNLRAFSSLVLECAHIIHEDDKGTIKYVKRIQQDLYDRGILPFMVESKNDRIKIDELQNNDVRELMRYVVLAFEYLEDDRWGKEMNNKDGSE